MKHQKGPLRFYAVCPNEKEAGPMTAWVKCGPADEGRLTEFDDAWMIAGVGAEMLVNVREMGATVVNLQRREWAWGEMLLRLQGSSCLLGLLLTGTDPHGERNALDGFRDVTVHAGLNDGVDYDLSILEAPQRPAFFTLATVRDDVTEEGMASAATLFKTLAFNFLRLRREDRQAVKGGK